MIGTRVVSMRRPPVAALACLGAAALGLVGGLATRHPWLGILSLLPAGIGIALLAMRAPAFQVRFTAEAMEVGRPPRILRYGTLTEVWPTVPPAAAGTPRPPSFPIDVVHDRGHLRIPADLSVPSERVYAYLRGVVTERRTLPADLLAFAQQQRQAFGAERVWAYGGRRSRFRTGSRPRAAAGMAMIVVAVLWFVAGVVRGEAGWYVGAAFGGIVGVVLALDGVRTGAAAAAPGGEGLVIGPTGLALRQGPLQGQLAWQEIRDVKFLSSGSFTVGYAGRGRLPAVMVKVEGAEILIPDAWDRPLGEIHERILAYWR